MKITSMEEYGLRCMLQLALSDSDGPMSVSEVAQNEGLSTEYAGKLLNMLRQAELVESVRGRHGGFVLARPSDDINLADILRVFSSDLFDEEYCTRHAGSAEICVHETSCAVRSLWSVLSSMVNSTLESMTLMDLACGEAHVEQDLHTQLDALKESKRDGIHRIQINENS